MKKSEWLDCQGNEFFPKTKGDSITGQDRAQKHCDFRFSQIEKKISKVAVLQLGVTVVISELQVFHTSLSNSSSIHVLDTCFNRVNHLLSIFLCIQKYFS